VSVRLYVDDAGFVRAPAPLVYRRLTHVAAWPEWWRGTRVREAAASGPGEAWSVELLGAPGRRLRYELRPHGWRHEHGFLLELRGDVVGAGEFWLEPTHGGTVVHHLLVATTVLPRPMRVLADHRRAIRRGLWGLKDAVQLEARTSIGLVP
jgi:uncharacterized protein YndB with AHSA1/START domain